MLIESMTASIYFSFGICRQFYIFMGGDGVYGCRAGVQIRLVNQTRLVGWKSQFESSLVLDIEYLLLQYQPIIIIRSRALMDMVPRLDRRGRLPV